ncbi:short-chain dehydrogenase TIC 32 B, chloroplastic-like isoform X2 [Zingiber officinale]|uniref:short-chain dehydrogenase TIC 32 B, chloroplastic-like isoform X2 n=1 Tax=Zingiber officinale TaxID=94328 RepID=UPI001C4D510C|nr:short-chain dehydrogenase TIC 32 B, chloroplastic-like isoform X2 [Zingiber officinale]
MGYWREATGIKGPSGFGSGNTVEQVTEGIDASRLTVIVAGGSSGIEAETARVSALRGAHVIIGARNLEAANAVKQNILNSIPSARIDIIQIELRLLSSLKSVRAFVEKFLAMNLPLNILINNAGVMYCPFKLSKDGVEMQFAMNHLGHFLLTNLLLEKLKTTAEKTGIESRIVNLSSVAHVGPYSEGIKFDKLNDKKAYTVVGVLSQSQADNPFLSIYLVEVSMQIVVFEAS